jgi:predicted methyltransferase
MTRPLLVAAILLALAPTAMRPADAATPKVIEAAVADSTRPAADKDRDVNRKPADVVAFAGVKPGQKVAELVPGSGYFTRIFSGVVGAKGHVYALPFGPRPNAPAGAPDMAAPVKAIAADPHYPNVTVVTLNPQQFTVPEPVDIVWTSQNYHDLHNILGDGIVGFDKQVLAALKPGGLFIIEDHAAAAGSGTRDTPTLHRIDPEVVKKELADAGFVFVGETDVLKDPDDPHTANVHDASIRGKTDQFVFKFRRP